jgi:hypothetical protein
MKGMVKAEGNGQEFIRIGKEDEKEPPRYHKGEPEGHNPGIIDIQKPSKNKRNGNYVSEQ